MKEQWSQNAPHIAAIAPDARTSSVLTLFHHSYIELTGIFRVMEKHQAILYSKWSETSRILDDLDVLEKESMKGGARE